MTPNVLNIGETITKEDGSRWVRVDVGIDWRDPASDTVVSVSAVVPVKAQGQLESEVRAVVKTFRSALQTIINTPRIKWTI